MFAIYTVLWRNDKYEFSKNGPTIRAPGAFFMENKILDFEYKLFFFFQGYKKHLKMSWAWGFLGSLSFLFCWRFRTNGKQLEGAYNDWSYCIEGTIVKDSLWKALYEGPRQFQVYHSKPFKSLYNSRGCGWVSLFVFKWLSIVNKFKRVKLSQTHS